MKEKIV